MRPVSHTNTCRYARRAVCCTVIALMLPLTTSQAQEVVQPPASAVAELTYADTSTDTSLDDQMLARQRGGAVGLLMVAATPQLIHGSNNGVTLWDEIAPPSPLPIPVDAARAAQGNVATYQRK
jgi:hypothetical protein